MRTNKRLRSIPLCDNRALPEILVVHLEQDAERNFVAEAPTQVSPLGGKEVCGADCAQRRTPGCIETGSSSRTDYALNEALSRVGQSWKTSHRERPIILREPPNGS